MRVLHWIFAIGNPGICFEAFDRLNNTTVSRVTSDKVLVGDILF
jgi:hypothetical protein